MIRQLDWDTEFFKKKMGVLTLDSCSGDNLADELEVAKNDQYKYILCQLKSPETANIHLLESHGFYLVDIGVTWFVGVDDCTTVASVKSTEHTATVAVAAVENIPTLKKLSHALFVDSRFYNDPFFSKEDADNLHAAWLENSVLGKAANIVFHVEDKGFITCKLADGVGEIILIGVKKECRGEGIGLRLVDSAIKWFLSHNVENIRVKTQLKNIGAMNFYRKLGFSIDRYDMTLAYRI
ncbi:MAG: GNAT family N-acetyltransferase [Gallionella sp.]|nr:GNAT family N-acetyltransferase [Gallionella sp.]